MHWTTSEALGPPIHEGLRYVPFQVNDLSHSAHRGTHSPGTVFILGCMLGEVAQQKRWLDGPNLGSNDTETLLAHNFGQPGIPSWKIQSRDLLFVGMWTFFVDLLLTRRFWEYKQPIPVCLLCRDCD